MKCNPRNFLETKGFSKKWADEGMSDENLQDLQVTITANPTIGPVISGTGGLRKVRVAAKNKGKRSGARVIYVNFDEYCYTVLVAFYAKNKDPDLTPDQKKELAKLIEKLEKSIKTNFFGSSRKRKEST